MPFGSFPNPEEDDSVSGSPEHQASTGRRLQSWKEIAAYLKRDPRTVQRWEKTESLPVRRHIHASGGSVYAYTSDLDVWLANRTQVMEPEPQADPSELAVPVVSEPVSAPQPAKQRLPWTSGVLAVALLTIALVWWIIVRSESRQEPTTFEPTPLSSLAGDLVTPSFTPDGKQVAYAWARPGSTDFRLMLKSVDGPEDRQITPENLNAFSPAVAPSGKQIAFLSTRKYDESPSIWLASLEGGRPVKLTDTGGDAWPWYLGLAWMPKGDMLVSVGRSATAEVNALYLYPIDHRPRQKITNPPQGSADYFPAISPDGKQLLFTRFGRGTASIYTTALNRSAPQQEPGTERILFQHLFASSSLVSSCWDPSGKAAFFVSNVGSTGQLWRARVSGQSIGVPEKLASLPQGLRDIARARGSGALVFSVEASNTNLWKVSLTDPALPPEQYGGMLASARDEIAARYSPDGSRLAFESNRSGAWQIWVAARDGSSASAITRYSGSVTGSPNWSPNGRTIAFDTRIAGKADVFVVPSSGGGEPKQVTRGGEPNVVPRWSRNGQWIYFASPGDGDGMQVWKIRPDGTGRVRITKDGGFAAEETLDEAWLYYTKRRDSVTALWRKSLRDGNEMEVAARVLDRCFATGRKGSFFVSAPSPYVPPSVQFQPFDANSPTLIRKLPRPISYGLAVSPDEREMTFAEIDFRGSNLEIVRNVR